MSGSVEGQSNNTHGAIDRLGRRLDVSIGTGAGLLLEELAAVARGEDKVFVIEEGLRKIASSSADVTQKMALLAIRSAFDKGLGNSPDAFQAHVLQMLQDELNRHFAHPAQEPSSE